MPTHGHLNPLRSLVRRFDAWLSRRLRVEAFTDDPQVILRIQSGHAGWHIPLEQARIQKGTPVLFIHLWNERIPPILPSGADLAWALRTQRLMIHSFRAVASHLQRTPALHAVQAVGGVIAQIHLDTPDGGRALLEGLGFTLFPYHRPGGRFGECWENFYTWWLMWAFNPPSAAGHGLLTLKRNEFWMTAGRFLELFGKE